MFYINELLIKAPLFFFALCACIIAVLLYITGRMFLVGSKSKKEHQLERHEHNPVIKPQLHKEWENVGTFNPAAVKDDEGFVHLLYRAIGNDGLSRIGHAKSRDGLKFDKRSPYPVYVAPISSVESVKDAGGEKNKDGKASTSRPHHFDTKIYTSGGGWGGYEDPRAVVIDNRVYMTYTAFEGWNNVRIALTSIGMEDFKKSRWNWKKPQFISPPGQVNKNWVLFPEKIDGKLAILHSISPEIKIDFLDDIQYDNKYIKSSAPSGGRPEYWDNWVRGAGPPPLKTDIGWLLLYHAMDKNDPNKYKLGAMILDLDEPTKILYRSHEPILEPDMPYENDWKPGVVYASGALILDADDNNLSGSKDLVVYYGGGDKYVCVAKTPLKGLLSWLVTYGKV
jgi:predicted GH43/DUF377 family glycosyl hydrolase